MLRNYWLSRQLGKIAQRLSLTTSRPIVWAPPRHISLEVTSFCNLRCPMCRLGQDSLGRKPGLMNYEKYCKFLDEISPFVPKISFPWYGEPFTRKDLAKFVRYASKKGMVVQIQTNGNLLNKYEMDFMVESNVSSIIIAIDGLSQKTYEIYRVGGNFADVTSGVKSLVALRKERGSKNPRCIQMNYIVMKHNEHELPHIEEFGKKLGVDRVKIKSAHLDRTEVGLKYLPTDPKYCRYEEGLSLKSGRDRMPGCSDLWRSAVISWDGTMGACCFDYDCKYSPGNVFDEGFFKIWFGEKMNEFRRQVLVDKKNISLCRGCNKDKP